MIGTVAGRVMSLPVLFGWDVLVNDLWKQKTSNKFYRSIDKSLHSTQMSQARELGHGKEFEQRIRTGKITGLNLGGVGGTEGEKKKLQ